MTMHKTRKTIVMWVVLASVLCSGCTSGGLGARLKASPPFAQAVVAADHELASRAGARILARGGNAVDAAVATSLALSVVRPYSCGIGGGGFMVIALHDQQAGRILTAIDYRETTPDAVGRAYYDRTGRSSTYGGTAVGVPGTVAGLLYAHEKYGKLPLPEIVQPAIELAESGFRVDAHYAEMAERLIERFAENPGWKKRFSFVWERMLLEGEVKEGDLISAPEQARVLRLIAERGKAGFYEGEVARQIVHAVRKDGGDMTLSDLRNYRPRETEPVRARVFGCEFVGMPPPSSGGVTMLEALLILEAAGYDAQSMCDDSHDAHLMAEAFKHAFADRSTWFGDPDFVDVPTQWLLSHDNIVQRAASIDFAHTQPPEAYGLSPPAPVDGGTSHFSVVDAAGNAVACTETINLEFGSLVGIDKFGFVLNDEMDDFLTVPGEPNAFGLVQGEQNLPEPGKRPLSSMAPTLVFDDEGLLAVAGASGGPRIITATMQVLLNVLAGASADEAVTRPRMHHQWLPNRLYLEPGAFVEGDVRAELESRGHLLDERGQIGNVQLIRRSVSGWDAACDPRKGGKPVGY